MVVIGRQAVRLVIVGVLIVGDDIDDIRWICAVRILRCAAVLIHGPQMRRGQDDGLWSATYAFLHRRGGCGGLGNRRECTGIIVRRIRRTDRAYLMEVCLGIRAESIPIGLGHRHEAPAIFRHVRHGGVRPLSDIDYNRRIIARRSAGIRQGQLAIDRRLEIDRRAVTSRIIGPDHAVLQAFQNIVINIGVSTYIYHRSRVGPVERNLRYRLARAICIWLTQRLRDDPQRVRCLIRIYWPHLIGFRAEIPKELTLASIHMNAGIRGKSGGGDGDGGASICHRYRQCAK